MNIPTATSRQPATKSQPATSMQATTGIPAATNVQAATVRMARWSATHPWRAMAMWVVFVAVCFVGGSASGTRQASDSALGTGESGRAAAMARAGGLIEPDTENVLITARRGRLDLAAAHRAANELSARMRRLPEVSSVAPPASSADSSAVVVAVTMSGDPDTASDRVSPLLAVTTAVGHGQPTLRVEQVGGASIDQGINDELGRSFARASSISLPLTLIILAIAFGAIVAAGLPVILALCSVFAAIGLSSLTSHLLPTTPTINEVILLIGMAVGVDYSLFYLKREREERARGRSRADSIEIAAATSGHSVLVSGFAVMVSMAGLYLATDVTFASLATGSIIVVAVAMLGSLTVLPALLATFGRAVDRPRIPILWRLTNRPDRPARLWPALLRPALRRPGITFLLAVAGLVALAQPALGMSLHSSGLADLPRAIPVVASYDRLTAAFPSRGNEHLIAVQAPSQDADAVRAALREVAQHAARDPLFAVADPTAIPIRESADHRVHTMLLPTPYGQHTALGERSLTVLRRDLLPSALARVPAHASIRHAVGGDIADDVDTSAHLRDSLPWVMGFVLLLTLLMMAVTFRSIVVALTAIFINLLSAGAAFGVLVLVFQHRWARGVLHLNDSGVIAWIPMFLFVVLFGLSMDYHVFVVSRIREGVRAGLSNRDAVRDGITQSAGVVTSAAAVMVSVFAVFATLPMVEFKQLGVGLSVAVLLDVLVVRIVLLPSIMTLLGRANWWPGRLSRPGPATIPAPAAAPAHTATVEMSGPRR